MRLKVGLFFFYALVLKSNFDDMPNVMCKSKLKSLFLSIFTDEQSQKDPADDC